MFKSASFKNLNKLNDRRRSQNNDTMTIDTMHSTVESSNTPNTNQQRLMKPRTYSNKTLNGRGETSSAKSVPNQHFDDYTEERRLSYSNDSPLSFTGSASFYQSESPSRSRTNLPAARDVSKRPSNASANSANRYTIAVDNSDVDVAAAIALLQELKKRASPEDLILLHKALLPTRNAEKVISLNKPEKRDDDEPLSPLIRRSSLLPAGVKTRLSRELLRNFSEDNVQTSRSTSREPVKTPKLDVPLHFEALDLANESFETQGNRPVTPSDFDCPQIGTYKLGSLRITNGAASPDSALLLNRVENGREGRQARKSSRKAAASKPSAEEVFVSADDEATSIGSVKQARAVRIIAAEPRGSSESEGRASMDAARATSRSRPATRRSSGDETDRRPSSRPSSRPTSRPASRPSSRPPSRGNQPQLASEIAEEYMAECNLPTDSVKESPPQLTTTMSRLSTVADESPTEEGAGSREDALKRLNGELNTANTRIAGRNSQSHLAPIRPSFYKSDSGYSSERRPASIVKENQVDEFLAAALDAADQAEKSRSKDSLVSDKENIPVAPVADVKQLTKAEKHRSLPSFFSRKSPSSTSVNTMASPPVTPKSSRKLQKSRPQSQRTVSGRSNKEATPEPEPMPQLVPVSVPAAADDSKVNFSRPTIDRAATSVEPSPQSKSAEHDNERRGRGRDRKSEPADADASPSGATRRRSSIFRFRSRSRSKSQHRKDEPVVLSVADEPLPTATFTDFGTVAQSLGQSPYDIATRKVKEMGPYDPSKPWFHPHEISRATPAPGAGVDSDMQLPNRYSRGPSMELTENDRARSQSRPRGRASEEKATPSDAKSSKPARGRFFRSRSAHAVPTVPAAAPASEPVPELPKAAAESLSQRFSKDGVVVGTIDFGNGFGQGRLAPILTRSEKAAARRRTQSVSPKIRQPLSPIITEEPAPIKDSAAQPPKVPVHARETVSVPVSPIVPRYARPQASVPPSPSTNMPSHGSVPPSPSVNTARPAQRASVAPLRTRPTTRHRESRSVPQSPVVPQSPAVPASPSMTSAWESQALAWRERKQGLNDMLSPTTDKRSSMIEKSLRPSTSRISPRPATANQMARPPSVVVSRYVTPSGSELAMHLGEQDPYKHLHEENPTDLRAPQEDIPRTDSGSTYRTAESSQTQDSFDSADSGKYRAYRPANAVPVTELTSPTTATTANRPSRTSFDFKRRSTAPPEDSNISYERYSGGLGYGWERGVGFGGSAGTRAKHDTKAARKSVILSENFGVDLSDVPVFLVRQ